MTDQPTPETDDFRPCPLTPSDWPAFARAMEIQRNAARAERDALSEALERNCVQYVQKQQAIIAERDALRADVARLRDVLQRIVNNDGNATNVMLFDARAALAQ
jgi:hypothetical protein